MKSNWIKYVFIIFIVIILIFSIFKIRKDEEEKQQELEYTSSQQEKVKEMTLGIASLDSINPILSNNKNVQDISKLIFDPLVTLSADYKAEPALAIEWAKQADNSYLIKLRENAKWTGGQRFTAEDVKFTIDRLKEISSVYSYNVQYVTGVDIVDDYTVKIYLDREIPFYEYWLTFPILSKDFYENEDFANTNKNTSPVGTGKYKIADVQPSYIVLEKNESWWNKQTNLTIEKITINLYSSIGELYNSFKIGNIDLISTSNDNLQEYIGTIGYSSKEMKGREHCFLALNTKSNFLSRLEVRKAISFSIDKENIVSSVFNSKCFTSSFPLDYGNWLMQGQDASSGFNIEQGKQILADNGWRYTGGGWQKTENYKTQRLGLNLLVKASDASKVAVAENIKQQLAAVGIGVNIVQASDEQYNNSVNHKNYDMVLCSMTLSPTPNLTTYFGEENRANYSNEEVTNILNEVKNTTDENILKEKYARLVEIYKTDVPYISLYNNKYLVAYNSGLVGEMAPNWFYQFYGIEGWYK
ncbi:MAG: peptide ABC transporter substrate-binding protein [Clostridia bacterium]|nr:peptide ABC transporter substrate-binding protein [Clostridia bacterium]